MSLSRLRELIVHPKASVYPVGTVVTVVSTSQVVVKTTGGAIVCSTSFPLEVGDLVRLQERVVIGKIITDEAAVPVFRV